jgi:serine/threonine protein phosphatase PrpC
MHITTHQVVKFGGAAAVMAVVYRDSSSSSSANTYSNSTQATAAAAAPLWLYASNVGDCRAVLCRGGVAMDLTRDHKPTCIDEQARVEASGGYIRYCVTRQLQVLALIFASFTDATTRIATSAIASGVSRNGGIYMTVCQFAR